MIITCVLTAYCKRADFEDDHVEVDEHPPHIYWDPNDPAIQGIHSLVLVRKTVFMCIYEIDRAPGKKAG